VGCGCNQRSTRTVYIVTFNDGTTEEKANKQEARALARMRGGTMSSKEVPK